MGDIVSDTDTSKGSTGFMYIKRDIVRLIAALTYHDRRLQDEVRYRREKLLIHGFCTKIAFFFFSKAYDIISIWNRSESLEVLVLFLVSAILMMPIHVRESPFAYHSLA